MQLVPERDLCFAILTNHSDGWMLNEDIATALLSRLEGLALSQGQRTGGNRGGNERMTEHSQPLATQPPLEEYTGRFVRKGVLAGFATAATVGSFDIAIDEGSSVLSASSRWRLASVSSAASFSLSWKH